MPITALAFIASGLALACMPPFNTWWSKCQLYVSLAEAGKWELALLTAFSSILLVASVIKSFNFAFMGEPNAKVMEAKEPTLTASLSLILASICIVLGLYPDPLFNWIWRLVG